MAKALKIVRGGVAGRHTTLPILTMVHLSCRPGKAILSTTDLEVHVHVETKADVAEAGDVTVPFSLFSALVGVLPGDAQIELVVPHTGERGRLTKAAQEAGVKAVGVGSEGIHGRWTGFDLEVKAGDRSAKLKTADPTDFPLIEALEGDAVTGYLDPGTLRQMIEQTAYAAAREDSRPILTGVILQASPNDEGDGGYLELGAADGFRLALSVQALECLEIGAVRVVIPAKHLADLSKHLADETEPVQVGIGASQVMFDLSGDAGPNAGQIFNIRMLSQLVEGTPPNLKQIIPPSCAWWMTLDKAELAAALNAVEVIAGLQGNAITLTVESAERVRMYTHDIEAGEIDIPVAVLANTGTLPEPDDRQIGLNVQFLSEAIAGVPDDRVRFGYNGPTRPFLVQGAEGESYRAVIMPMTVR